MPGRILVVDDVATNRIVMKVRLTDAYYEVLQADGGHTALEAARRERPDLILLDLVMKDMDGVEVCKRLKADPRTRDIPVIVVTAARQPHQKLRALRAGAEDFLSKPLDELTLLARVRSLLRAQETAQELALRERTQTALGFRESATDFTAYGLIGLICASREKALSWKNGLGDFKTAELRIMTRGEAMTLTEHDRIPDIFLVDGHQDRSQSGLSVLTDLRVRPATRHSSVLMVVEKSARQVAAMALDLGANDLISADFDAQELTLRLETQLRRKQQADRLRASVGDGLRLAVTDPLTGLFNRRYADPHLAGMAKRAQETGKPFAVLQLDIDRFKCVNDRHGHPAGDAVLEHLARTLATELRAVDMIARTGGEEFLAALPETDLKEATAVAERLRHKINSTPIPLPGNAGMLTISVSIGLAVWDGPACDIGGLLSRADRALYAAKTGGRNTVIVAGNAA